MAKHATVMKLCRVAFETMDVLIAKTILEINATSPFSDRSDLRVEAFSVFATNPQRWASKLFFKVCNLLSQIRKTLRCVSPQTADYANFYDYSTMQIAKPQFLKIMHKSASKQS